MKNVFTDDVKLLVELDALIKEQQNTVNMNPIAKDIAGALFPGMAKLIPAGQKMAAQKLDTLTRVKARLNELIEKEHSEAE